MSTDSRAYGRTILGRPLWVVVARAGQFFNSGRSRRRDRLYFYEMGPGYPLFSIRHCFWD